MNSSKTPLSEPAMLHFREQVQAFLNAELTDDLRAQARQTTSVFFHPEVSLAWQRILNRRGWAAPDWPEEFGGTGWNEQQRYIFAAECALAGAPTIAPMGMKMIAPVIIHYGTKAQQQHYLPRLLSGDDYWCQGFSEPGAGSDLASLRLRATRDGDDYVLNGTKVWTTHAQFANRMFCLARTSTDGRPQSGISFLLVDMHAAGIKVDPIITMSGEHELNQVFFDNVHISVADRLGEENDGWTVAKFLLAHERGGRYAPGLMAYLIRIQLAAREMGMAGDPLIVAELSRLRIALETLQAIELKAMSTSARVDPTTPSVLKVLGTETSQRMDRLAMKVAGDGALVHSLAGDCEIMAVAVPRYLNNRAASIYAGSNEIQRDLIARQALAG